MKNKVLEIAIFAIAAAALTSFVIGLIWVASKPVVPNGMTKQVTVTYTYVPENDQTRKE